MSLIVLYFLHGTSVLSFYIDVVLTLSIWMDIREIDWYKIKIIHYRYYTWIKPPGTQCLNELYTVATHLEIDPGATLQLLGLPWKDYSIKYATVTELIVWCASDVAKKWNMRKLVNQRSSTVNLSSLRYLCRTSASLDRWQTLQMVLTSRVSLTRSVVSLAKSNVPITWANSMSAALGSKIPPLIGFVPFGNAPLGGKVNPTPGIIPGGKGIPGGNAIPGGSGIPPGGKLAPGVVMRGFASGDPSVTAGPCGVPGGSLGMVAATPGDGTSPVSPGDWLELVPISTIIEIYFAPIYNSVKVITTKLGNFYSKVVRKRLHQVVKPLHQGYFCRFL